jgi:glycosyltransferase involved in cell wall biosynthesis
MRILQVGKFYAPDKGGMETALRHLSEGLLAAGHEVRVLVAGHGPRTVREDLPGVPGGLVRAGALGTWNGQPLTFGLPILLRRELATFDPDIVHLHLPNPLACLAWRLASPRTKRARPLLAVWHHADIVRQRRAGRLVGPLVRRCLTEAAGICVSSEAWRGRSHELAPWRTKVAVIPFGIDLAPFLAREPLGAGPLLFVGRLVPYKGLDELLEAVAGLPDVRLDIVGDGPERARLVRRCAAGDLHGRVRLRGEVPDADLPAVMAGSLALVLPSRDLSETFGLVLVEAMAAGLPLITSDLPTGVRELNRPGETGWLVAPGDAAALRSALAEVIADPGQARRLGRNGRILAEQRYSRDRLAEDLGAWYSGLAGDVGTDERRGG